MSAITADVERKKVAGLIAISSVVFSLLVATVAGILAAIA